MSKKTNDKPTLAIDNNLLTTNLEGIEATPQVFGLLPVGKYHATIDEAEIKLSTQNKTPFLWIQFNISGYNADNNQPTNDHSYNDRKIFDSIFLTDKAQPRLKLVLDALGFDTDDEIALDTKDLAGRSCLLWVEHKRQENYDTTARPSYGGYSID